MSEVMSQEEIDALVGSEPDPLSGAADPAPVAAPAPAAAAPAPAPAAVAAPEAAAPAPAPAAVAAPEAAAPAPAPAPAGPAPTLIVSASGSDTPDISQRLANLEATVATLQQSAGGGQNDAVIQALSQQVQALSAQLAQLGQHLQNSLGFGLRGSFQCASCATQGAVGSRVSCMHCGTESWIGWPEQSA